MVYFYVGYLTWCISMWAQYYTKEFLRGRYNFQKKCASVSWRDWWYMLPLSFEEEKNEMSGWSSWRDWWCMLPLIWRETKCRCVDGVCEEIDNACDHLFEIKRGVDNGWACHRRLEEVEAMCVCRIYESSLSHGHISHWWSSWRGG